MRELSVLLGVGLLLAGGAPVVAHAASQDFRLVNQTGVEINNLYVSPSESDDWEEDVLGADTLPDGASLTIKFSGREECLWDVMVTDSDGNAVYWRKIDLCEVAKVVLHYDGENAWATFD
jgi:hypothetical protein